MTFISTDVVNVKFLFNCIKSGARSIHSSIQSEYEPGRRNVDKHFDRQTGTCFPSLAQPKSPATDRVFLITF